MYTIKMWIRNNDARDLDKEICFISRNIETIPEAIGHIQTTHDNWEVLEIHIYKGE